MFVTVLPKPDESYICAAKVDDITPYGNDELCLLRDYFILLLFRRDAAGDHPAVGRGPVHQREARLLRRLHLLWTHDDLDPGLPCHQAM